MRRRAAGAYRLITCTALGAAALGVALPLLPTAPFLLVAAWSASRHSPELEARLLAHPGFGPHLRAWRRERALSRRAKVLASTSLVASLGLVWLVVEPLWVQALVSGIIAAVAAFLVTRAEFDPAAEEPHHLRDPSNRC